jgi:hypothetical protein
MMRSFDLGTTFNAQNITFTVTQDELRQLVDNGVSIIPN